MENISVFGLGKLGCTMVGCFARSGYGVVGVDIDSSCVESVASGRPSVSEPGLDEVFAENTSRISATMNEEIAVINSNVSFIIVPTPSLRSGEFFTSIAKGVAAEIGKALKKKRGYHLVVLTSTVLPGASRRDIISTLERCSRKRCGKDFGFCYSPEFIAIGNVVEGLVSPDFFLIGEYDKKSGDTLERFYHRLWHSRPRKQSERPCFARMSIENAELTKISVNAFVTSKISFANTISRICAKLPAGDAFDVTRAIGLDKRIGGKYLAPGPAFGGPCFPRDNRAFAWYAKQVGEAAPLARATDEINVEQIDYLIDLIITSRPGARRIGLLGLSYKDNTNLMEESQAVAIAESLIGRGYEVTAFDPEVARCGVTKEVRGLQLEHRLRPVVENGQIVVIATNHAEFQKLKPSAFEKKRRVLVDLWGMHFKKWQNKSWYTVPGVSKT